MNAKRLPLHAASKAIFEYRKLAHQAKMNADRAADADARNWFLSLAKTMTKLADALQDEYPHSN